MCLFPNPNFNFDSIAYKKGVREFDCGACPECLRKRSNVWALRSVYESKSHVSNVMITLTYDDYERDEHGRIIGELPPDPNRTVSVRDAQLFIKRLRKWYSSVSDEKIKYILCAEYGSRTHRAHYHAILFGVKFPDIYFYKKSKRGNAIYKSHILDTLWRHGICTVDSINVSSAIARYCTKYCAKSRSDDTFMLTSQRIGLDNLLKSFNGKSYIVEGREYPIPRIVWQEYIMNRYSECFPAMDYRYINKCHENFQNHDYQRGCAARRLYRYVRDCDPVYVSYLDYWMQRGKLFESLQLPVFQRILQLPDAKFRHYKSAALFCHGRRQNHIPEIAPGSGCKSRYFRYIDARNERLGIKMYTCPISSRLNRASDTNLRSKPIYQSYTRINF